MAHAAAGKDIRKIGGKMADSLMIATSVIGLVLTVVAGYYSFYIYRIYRNLTMGWRAITVGIAISAASQMVMIAANSGLASGENGQLWLIGMAGFALSAAVYLYGFWQMKGEIEENERVERETMKRIHEFEIKHRRHEELRLRSSRRDRGRRPLGLRQKNMKKMK